MANRYRIVAGLDIGTQKIALVVGERRLAGLEVLGIGTAPSRGVRAGRICDVEATTKSISVALSEAELMAGCQINEVWVSVSGDHVRGSNSHGVVGIDNGEVSGRAVRKVRAAAQAVPLPPDHRVLHVLPRDYVVDTQDGIQDPVGMSGVRLEVNLHLISISESVLGNLRKCCHKAGLSVSGVVASSLVSAEAVLEPEEKELGVVLVDFGAGTLDVAIYNEGALVHSAVLTCAGDRVTKDLSRCLETTGRDAEAIKQQHGCALASLVERNVGVEVGGVGGREPRIVSRRLVAEIIEARMEEIFENILEVIIRSGYGETISSGVVLTGGATMMQGVSDVAAGIIDLPVRVGEPVSISGLTDEISDPSWATAVGLTMGLGVTDLAEEPAMAVVERLLPEWVRKRMKEFF